MERTDVRVELRSFTMGTGEQSAMMLGTYVMGKLCADNLTVEKLFLLQYMAALDKALATSS